MACGSRHVHLQGGPAAEEPEEERPTTEEPEGSELEEEEPEEEEPETGDPQEAGFLGRSPSHPGAWDEEDVDWDADTPEDEVGESPERAEEEEDEEELQHEVEEEEKVHPGLEEEEEVYPSLQENKQSPARLPADGGILDEVAPDAQVASREQRIAAQREKNLERATNRESARETELAEICDAHASQLGEIAPELLSGAVDSGAGGYRSPPFRISRPSSALGSFRPSVAAGRLTNEQPEDPDFPRLLAGNAGAHEQGDTEDADQKTPDEQLDEEAGQIQTSKKMKDIDGLLGVDKMKKYELYEAAMFEADILKGDLTETVGTVEQFGKAFDGHKKLLTGLGGTVVVWRVQRSRFS